jgi:ADP-ribose pyrophosphatase YjhB (NUDIX family)
MRREYPEAPIVTVGLVVRRGDRVLVVQRGNPPNKGRWSIPGGAVEVGEALRETGQREVREECGIEVAVGAVAGVFETILPDDAGRTRYHYVMIDFLADYVSGDLHAASDSADARWVTGAELAALDVTEKARELLEQVLR